MTSEEVQKLADLANIKISEEEREKFSEEIEDILQYVSKVSEVSGEKLEKKAGTLRNVMREDEKLHKTGEFSEEILEEAPKTRDGFLEVGKIL